MKEESQSFEPETANANGQQESSEEPIVRVRGLPWSCTKDELIDFMGDIPVKDVRFTYSKSGRPSGEAYVVLQAADDLRRALEMDDKMMGHRRIEIFEAKAAEMNYVLEHCGKPTVTAAEKQGVIRLRGLAFETMDSDLVEFFEGLEIVPHGILLPLDDKGRCAGEAYVQFKHPGDVDTALQKHMQKLGRRYVEVFRSTETEMKFARRRAGRMDFEPDDDYGYPPQHRRRPTPYDRPEPPFRRGGPPSLFDRPMPPSRHGGYPPPFRGPPDRRHSPPRGGPMGGYPPRGPPPRRHGHFVHMRGLPYKAKEGEIADFFRPLNVIGVNIIMEESGRPSGEAEVEFATHDDAVEAMKRDNDELGSRYIELFLMSSADRNKPKRPEQSAKKPPAPTTVQYPGQERYTAPRASVAPPPPPPPPPQQQPSWMTSARPPFAPPPGPYPGAPYGYGMPFQPWAGAAYGGQPSTYAAPAVNYPGYYGGGKV